MPNDLDFKMAGYLMDGLSNDQPTVTGTDLKFADGGNGYTAEVHLGQGEYERVVESTSTSGWFEAAGDVVRMVLWELVGD